MTAAFALLFSLGIAVTTGCSHPSPRVVRAGFASSGKTCRVSLNGGIVQAVQLAQLTNLITALHLRHGDVVLVDHIPTEPQLTWIANYCSEQRAGFYFLSVPEEREGIFSVPICHWVAPFEDPVNLSNSTFYVEGRRLGQGEQGFRHLLGYINQNKPKLLLLMGSKYNWDSSWGPDMMPFEDSSHMKALEAALASAGTEWLTPSALP